MKTRITEMLGIEYPIIQGGMAWVAEHHLAAAVSEAGGLGLIGGANAPGEVVREEIRKAKALTKKPFGVNVMLMSPYADDVAKVVVEEGVKVVTTGAGNPAKYMKMWKEAGIIVIPVVASVALAKLMERGGADAVVAEGTESGGHIGEATTMTLVPQVVDAVSIPVIAAGGIGDGRGIAAAFMLGAEAVQMGTRFVVAKGAGRRNGVPGAQIRVVDALLRVAVTAEDVPGNPRQEAAVFAVGLVNSPLIPLPVQVDDLRVLHVILLSPAAARWQSGSAPRRAHRRCASRCRR